MLPNQRKSAGKYDFGPVRNALVAWKEISRQVSIWNLTDENFLIQRQLSNDDIGESELHNEASSKAVHGLLANH